MKWLKRKLRDWVREADYEGSEKAIVSARDLDSPDTEPVLTFRIYSANNGKILEFRRYDRKNDRSDNSTYIIEKDKDISEYVAKCLSLEMLK
jgi:hypothetical protein